MPKSLSVDLCERIAAALHLAHESHPLIAERFSVSIFSVEKISRRLRKGKLLEPALRPGRSKLLGDNHLAFLRKEVARTPYATSYELTLRFNKKFSDPRVHRSTILRVMHELGFSFKVTAQPATSVAS